MRVYFSSLSGQLVLQSLYVIAAKVLLRLYFLICISFPQNSEELILYQYICSILRRHYSNS